MKAEINVVVKEPFSVAGEHQAKDAKVKLTPEEARIAVGGGKAKFATDEDKAKCYQAGELGEPGVRTRVGPGSDVETEYVTEHKLPYVDVDKNLPAHEYAKLKREDGEGPTTQGTKLDPKKVK